MIIVLPVKYIQIRFVQFFINNFVSTTVSKFIEKAFISNSQSHLEYFYWCSYQNNYNENVEF